MSNSKAAERESGQQKGCLVTFVEELYAALDRPVPGALADW